MARRAVDNDVVHDDERRLATQLERHGSQVLSRSSRDSMPGPDRFCQGDQLGDRVAHERLAEGGPGAGQDTDHPGWQASLFEDGGQGQR
jgi:hypothetical protein